MKNPNTKSDKNPRQSSQKFSRTAFVINPTPLSLLDEACLNHHLRVKSILRERCPRILTSFPESKLGSHPAHWLFASQFSTPISPPLCSACLPQLKCIHVAGTPCPKHAGALQPLHPRTSTFENLFGGVLRTSFWGSIRGVLRTPRSIVISFIRGF